MCETGCGVRRVRDIHTNLQLNPSLETIKMWFKHFCMEIVFIPPHTLLGMQKTKTKQKQSEGLKSLHQSLKIHPSDWRYLPPNTYTQIIWWSSRVRFCAFKANQSAKHFTESQGVSVDLNNTTVSSDWIGQHRAVNEKTHRVNGTPNLTGERVLRVLQVRRPAVAVTVISALGAPTQKGARVISEHRKGLFSTWKGMYVYDLL